MYLHPLEVTGWPVLGLAGEGSQWLATSQPRGGWQAALYHESCCIFLQEAVNDWYDVNNGRGVVMITGFEDPFQKVKLSFCLMECASDQSLSVSSQEDGNTVCTGRWLMSTMLELG